MFRPRMFSLLSLALSCAIPLTGCRSYHTRPPSNAEKILMQQDKGVIVLLRLRTVVDGVRREEIRLVEKEKRYGFGFNVDKGNLPGRDRHCHPSSGGATFN